LEVTKQFSIIFHEWPEFPLQSENTVCVLFEKLALYSYLVNVNASRKAITFFESVVCRLGIEFQESNNLVIKMIWP
jgi:hypothetical protein